MGCPDGRTVLIVLAVVVVLVVAVILVVLMVVVVLVIVALYHCLGIYAGMRSKVEGLLRLKTVLYGFKGLGSGVVGLYIVLYGC